MEASNTNFLTVAEFCVRNRICRSTFYNLAKSGQIKMTKLGAKTLVSVAEEQRFLSSLNDVA